MLFSKKQIRPSKKKIDIIDKKKKKATAHVNAKSLDSDSTA